MPIYVYVCEDGHKNEKLVKNYESGQEYLKTGKCIVCGKPLIKKVYGNVAVKVN